MTAAPAEAMCDQDLFQVIYNRSLEWDIWGRYDPWVDLRRRTGLSLEWHPPGPIDRFESAWGLTHWKTLTVSLQLGLSGLQLRGVLAHELAHLDRGPWLQYRGGEKAEERRVELLAAQRLVDPVVFDALMARCDGRPTNYRIFAALQVSTTIFDCYAEWRRKVKPATAMKRWEQGREVVPWPAPWIEKYQEQAPLAAVFSGLKRDAEAAASAPLAAVKEIRS